jgi:hypothetical protein
MLLNWTKSISANDDIPLDNACVKLPPPPVVNHTLREIVMTQIDAQVNFTFTCERGYGISSWYAADKKTFSCEANTTLDAFDCQPDQFCKWIQCDFDHSRGS